MNTKEKKREFQGEKIHLALSLKELNSDFFSEIRQNLLESNITLITVNKSDYSQGRLSASQINVETDKLLLALEDKAFPPNPISATLVQRMNSKGKIVYELIFVDGHHRAAVKLNNGTPFEVEIIRTWDQVSQEANPNTFKTLKPFSVIFRQVREALS